jgi:peptidoglycan hydrolase-like protein with peptidoglycan-binding domain
MPGAISPWPVLHIGQQGRTVRTLQLLLRAHGRDVVVDGIFGAQTDAAVSGFQTIKGLPASGIVDADTWKALIVPVGKGSNGDAVRSVQEELGCRNDCPDSTQELQIDGIFGPKTVGTVLLFQQALSRTIPALPVDGSVDPLAWQALVSGMLAC